MMAVWALNGLSPPYLDQLYFVLMICLVVIACAYPHRISCRFRHIVYSYFRPTFVSSCCIHPLEQPAFWYSLILLLDRFLPHTIDTLVTAIISRHFAVTIHILTMLPWTLATLAILMWLDFIWLTTSRHQLLLMMGKYSHIHSNYFKHRQVLLVSHS